MERKGDVDCVKACSRLVVEGTAPVVGLKNTWQNNVSADMRLVKVDSGDIHERMKWTAIGQLKANPAMSGTLS